MLFFVNCSLVSSRYLADQFALNSVPVKFNFVCSASANSIKSCSSFVILDVPTDNSLNSEFPLRTKSFTKRHWESEAYFCKTAG